MGSLTFISLISLTFLLGTCVTALFVFHILESMLVEAAKGTHLRVDDLTVKIRVSCNGDRYEGLSGV